jgi:hypothetical protein
MKAELVALLVLSLCPFAKAANGTCSDEVKLQAIVKQLAMLTEFSGKAIPVSADPRFALTLRVKSVQPAAQDMAAGSEVTFAIHSPSLLFSGEAQKGKTYVFTVCREVSDGNTKFGGLRVVNARHN